MEQKVSHTEATKELVASYKRVHKTPQIECPIKDAIDFVLTGKNCLTYRYILLTALVAKATNPNIDILSLQAGDDSQGAYDARSLASRVVFPFQRDFLEDALDGSNEDPLVNNPGRHPRLSKKNKSAGGDPKRALFFLCDELPKVADQATARECLDYYIFKCLGIAEAKRNQSAAYSTAIITIDVFSARRFLDELLDKNFGGLALLLVANSIFSITHSRDKGFEVIPHPVNQSGATGGQIGDIDIRTKDGTPYLAIELKDKPFTSTEVAKAAETAYKRGTPAMLFVAGRASTLTDEVRRYFDETKAQYEDKGMVIGIISIDALLDYFFVTHYDFEPPFMFSLLEDTLTDVAATPEAVAWVYRKAEDL